MIKTKINGITFIVTFLKNTTWFNSVTNRSYHFPNDWKMKKIVETIKKYN